MKRRAGNTLRSCCGDIVVRGEPGSIAQKYETLAAEAAASRDHVKEQAYLQHAEHYRRVERQ